MNFTKQQIGLIKNADTLVFRYGVGQSEIPVLECVKKRKNSEDAVQIPIKMDIPFEFKTACFVILSNKSFALSRLRPSDDVRFQAFRNYYQYNDHIKNAGLITESLVMYVGANGNWGSQKREILMTEVSEDNLVNNLK